MIYIPPDNNVTRDPPNTYTPPEFDAGAVQFYGKAIPISMGRRMIVGVPLWQSQFSIVKDNIGGGNIPDSSKYVSFAIGFGQSGTPDADLIATAVLRVWFNDELVIDRVSTSGWAAHPALSFTVYDGTATQKPDPLIKADERNAAVAFRDQVYIVFQDVPLHVFNLDTLPFVRAELADIVEDVSYVQEFTTLSGAQDDVQDNNKNWSAVDWKRQRLITFRDEDTPTWVQVYNIAQNKMVASNLIKLQNGNNADVGLDVGDAITMPDTGYMVLTGEITDDFIMILDPMTGRSKGEATMYAPRHLAVVPFRQVWLDGDDLGPTYLIAAGSLFDDVGVFLWHSKSRVNIGGGHKATINQLQPFFDSFNMPSNLTGMQTGESLSPDTLNSSGVTGRGIFYVSDQDTVYRMEVPTRSSKYDGNKAVVSGGDFVYKNDTGIIISPFWTCPNANEQIAYIMVDEVTAEVLVLYYNTVTSDYYAARVYHPNRFGVYPFNKKNNTTIAETGIEVFGPTVIPEFLLDRKPGWNKSNIGAGTLGYYSGTDDKFVILFTRTGTYAEFDPDAWRIIGESSNQPGALGMAMRGPWYSPGQYFLNASTNVPPDYGWSKVYVGRAPEVPMPLSDILSYWMQLAGLETSDFTIAGVSDQVYGSILVERVSLSTLLSDASQAFDFEWYESEGKIKIEGNPRGVSFNIDYDLTADELAWVGGDEESEDRQLLVTKRNSEDKPPVAIELRYLNMTANYSVDLARAKRTSFPVNTSQDGPTVTLSVPVVMKPSQAGKYAIQALYAIWAGLTIQEFRLGQQFYDLEPTDIVRITLGSFQYVLKVSEGALNGDWSVSAAGTTYSSDNDVEIGVDEPLTLGEGVSGPSSSDLWWIDSPRIGYDADTINTNLTFYTAVTSQGTYGWTGATLYYDNSGSLSIVYRNTFDATVAGRITNVPGAIFTDVPAIDEINTLELVIETGGSVHLNAATDGEMLDGANFCFWGDDDRWEIIQFGEYTVNSDGTVTLGRIIRGRRGTEVNMRSHLSGDRFILLDGSIKTVSLPLASLDEEANYRVVGDDEELPLVSVTSVTATGNSRKPYAPVHLTATLDGSDYDLAWVRRTRVLTELVDSIDDTPLEEDTEEYELEILDGPDGTVLRTVTGLTSAAYTYGSADIATDFGSPPAVLTFRVYQISGTVGRGFPGEQTVEVE